MMLLLLQEKVIDFVSVATIDTQTAGARVFLTNSL